jgi:hypothetical protein
MPDSWAMAMPGQRRRHAVVTFFHYLSSPQPAMLALAALNPVGPQQCVD